jgi:hypothetical protein
MSATPVPPWQPTGLPTLRAAYSDRTAALMAYLSSFAYSREIEKRGSYRSAAGTCWSWF